MAEAKTLIQFLKRCKKFASDNTFTLDLIVDGDTTVADLNHVLESECGGLIATIEDTVSEVQDRLIKHYEKEGNKRMVKKLLKI